MVQTLEESVMKVGAKDPFASKLSVGVEYLADVVRIGGTRYLCYRRGGCCLHPSPKWNVR
jgi:hypothetical protein